MNPLTTLSVNIRTKFLIGSPPLSIVYKSNSNEIYSAEMSIKIIGFGLDG